MTMFNPGDIVYWVFPNGDKAACTVLDIVSPERLRIMWHKDEFVILMPTSGFIKDELNG